MSVIDPFPDSGSTTSANAHEGESAASRDVAMLAHDMRGALQGVMGGIAMIDAAGLDAALREQMARVVASAETLSYLVDAFLDEDPGPASGITCDVVDMASFLSYLARRWNGEARQKGLRFGISTGPDLPTGLAVDQVALARIIGNLVGNSVAHAATGAILVTVERTAGGGVAFRLHDEGPGVNAQALDQVARRGYSPRDSTRPAHGLGLHIVRELAHQIGAAVTLGNRASGGFEAVLSFPPELCLGEGAAPRRDAPEQSRRDLTGVRILLAEDNPTNQMVATQMLRALNAHVALAADGIEALEHFETGVFDLVVVDIEMPRMSGLDVIRAIRSRRDQRAGVPIVALTAYALREHQDRIADAGANGLISKPISSIEALGRALMAHVPSARQPPAATPVAPAVVALAGPVVDLAIYEALRQAIGPNMMAELMEKVVIDLLSARAELSGALDPMDRAPLRSASHILISVAGAIGAVRLQSCARALNIAAHGEVSPDIATKVQACVDELDVAVVFAREQRADG